MNLYNSKKIYYFSNSNIFSKYFNSKQYFKELKFNFSNKKKEIRNLCFNLKKASLNFPINEKLLNKYKNSIEKSEKILFNKKLKKKCYSVSSMSTNISNNINNNLISNSLKKKRPFSSINNMELITNIKNYSIKPKINKNINIFHLTKQSFFKNYNNKNINKINTSKIIYKNKSDSNIYKNKNLSSDNITNISNNSNLSEINNSLNKLNKKLSNIKNIRNIKHHFIQENLSDKLKIFLKRFKREIKSGENLIIKNKKGYYNIFPENSKVETFINLNPNQFKRHNSPKKTIDFNYLDELSYKKIKNNSNLNIKNLLNQSKELLNKYTKKFESNTKNIEKKKFFYKKKDIIANNILKDIKTQMNNKDLLFNNILFRPEENDYIINKQYNINYNLKNINKI